MQCSYYSCYAALCPDPVDIDHGNFTFTGNSVGDTATYSCNPGFELIKGDITTCTQVDAYNATFSPQPPFCRREFCIISTRILVHVFFSVVSILVEIFMQDLIRIKINSETSKTSYKSKPFHNYMNARNTVAQDLTTALILSLLFYQE